MRELVTPRQVAKAIGVSESSLKRWCDQGLLTAVRTAGGHRRLRVADVIQYVREQGHALVDPQLLGLPAATVGSGPRSLARSCTQLQEALIRGDEPTCGQLILDLYLNDHGLATICDEVIAPAFHAIGDLWDCGDIAIYEERRSCEISLRLLQNLRRLTPENDSAAPRAIGGTLSGDRYAVPTTMAELVLRDAGWNAVSLGTDLPVSTLLEALDELRPRLFWLSITHVPDPGGLHAALQQIAAKAKALDSTFVFGGRAAKDEWEIPDAQGLKSMQELLNLARSLSLKTEH